MEHLIRWVVFLLIAILVIGAVLYGNGNGAFVASPSLLRPLRDLIATTQGNSTEVSTPSVIEPLPSTNRTNTQPQLVVGNVSTTPSSEPKKEGERKSLKRHSKPSPSIFDLTSNVTRASIVCQYTSDTTRCNKSNTDQNPFSHATPGVRESPIDPHVLLDAYRREPGLRQLMDMLERTHLPVQTQCRLRGKDPPGPDQDTSRLCVTADMLNPRVALQPFSQFRDSGPFRRPPAHLRKEWFRYEGFPYVTGHGFMKLADFEYETDNWLFGRRHIRFDDSKLMNRSLVYWHLEGRDLQTLKRRISELTHHIFIICNSLDEPEFPPWLLNNPYILKIFSVNIPAARANHPKLFPIPIGIRYTISDIVQDGRALKRQLPPKDVLLASFTVGHNTVRAKRRLKVLEVMQTNFRFSRDQLEQKNPKYNEAVLSHKFNLSPAGLGLDAYRTWQTLYFGRIPVVGPELPASLYEGLPVLQVSDWSVLTPKLLATTWTNLSHHPFLTDKLTILWWIRTILRECLLTV